MTKLKDAMGWFKSQFKEKIQEGIKDTPFSVDLLTAIATQETYYIWGKVYKTLTVDEVLALCASDTIDASGGRDEFPRDKADLLTAPRGAEMFTIGREALKALGAHLPDFTKYGTDQFPEKFCRGYGIFQYDLQFYKDNPDFFLEKRWHDFDECLSLLLKELNGFFRKYFSGHSSLTDKEMVYLAIAYNKGSVNLAKGFQQGHKDDGKYYGENIWEYLQLSKTVT